MSIDPETLDMDQLIDLANKELSGEKVEESQNQQEEKVEEQPEQVENQTEEVDEVVYRRAIDLGDGSGTQVFEAPTMEELVDKLAEAQKNATKKIRELTAEKKTPTPQEQQALSDEEYVLAQQLATNPSLAFDKLFQKKFGKTPEQFQKVVERAEAYDRAESERTAAEDFVSATPDYFACKENGTKISKYLETYQLEGTTENMKKAFEDLSESGLLKTKPQTQDAETQNGTRIVTVQGHQRKAASGLSTRRTASVTKTTGLPTEEEAYKMDLDKLEILANKELAGQLQ